MTLVGVIANPSKTLGLGLGALRETLARRGVVDPLWREAPAAGAVAEMVAELLDAGVDRLFVWGGDGTVRQCIEAVGTAPVTLAILPAGTGNLLARNLGIPTDLERAVSIGLSGHRRTLDVGTVNGEPFAVMAGVGFDADMVRETGAGLKEKLGSFAYVLSAVRGVGRDAVRACVRIDGEDWFEGPATCVLVGNMGDVLAGISAFPDARPDDGRLDVGVVTAEGAVEWALTLGSTLIGDPGSSPFVETVSATGIDVSLGTKLAYELDGDSRPATGHLSFRVQPAAITVCVPGIREAG